MFEPDQDDFWTCAFVWWITPGADLTPDVLARDLATYFEGLTKAVVGDQEIDLTTYEYKVFEYLLMHPDEVVTKTVLSEHIYEEDADRDSNVIEVFIGRLRKKLDPDNVLKPIKTVRGAGYRFALERHSK